MKNFVLSLAFSLLAGTAFAGEQYLDETGFAASGYDVVSYFDLEQAAIGQSQPLAALGQRSITADYNGATFAFSSTANRDRFLTNPAGFAPQYDGHCAYGVSKGGKVPGNPNLWRIVDGKLYLNITTTVRGFWEEDITGNLLKSESNWLNIEAIPASTNTIPKFMSTAPVGN